MCDEQRDGVVIMIMTTTMTLTQSCTRVGWTHGSGWVTILPDFIGSAFRDFLFLLIISRFLNRYESSNTTFGLTFFRN